MPDNQTIAETLSHLRSAAARENYAEARDLLDVFQQKLRSGYRSAQNS